MYNAGIQIWNGVVCCDAQVCQVSLDDDKENVAMAGYSGKSVSTLMLM